MPITQIHAGLANTASLFVAILAIWALLLAIRSRPLDGGWLGAAVIGELLLIAQFSLGWVLWFQGYGADLPRAWIHILYGAVAVITLPAAYTYFSNIKEHRVQTLAMFAVCAFLWGIVARAGQVVYLQTP
jgi:hypothetical protein